MAIACASPVAGQYSSTLSATASGTITSGDLNCGSSTSNCIALGVCTSATKTSAVLTRFSFTSFPTTTTVVSASLTLPVTVAGAGAPSISIYAVSADWTTPTGTAVDTNPCTSGTPGAGQPTYEHQALPSTTWSSTAGQTGALLIGPLSPLNNNIGDAFATGRSSQALLNLVRQWVNGTTPNFGLVIVGANSTDTNRLFLGTPTLTISTDQFVPVTPPTKSVTYTPPTSTTRTPSGIYIPTRYTGGTGNGAIIGGVIGGVAFVILAIAAITAVLRGGSSSSYSSRRSYGRRTYRY